MDSRSDNPGEDPAVSYLAAVPGTPVLTRSGTEIGTVEHVLQVPELDLFDGIVIATDWGLRFVRRRPDRPDHHPVCPVQPG